MTGCEILAVIACAALFGAIVTIVWLLGDPKPDRDRAERTTAVYRDRDRRPR